MPADTAHRIRVGDAVTLDTTSRQGARGRVSAVVPAIDPTTQSSTVTVSGAVIDAVPGDAVTATIVVDHRTGLLVPSSAIVQDPQTGQTVVFVQKPDGSFALAHRHRARQRRQDGARRVGLAPRRARRVAGLVSAARAQRRLSREPHANDGAAAGAVRDRNRAAEALDRRFRDREPEAAAGQRARFVVAPEPVERAPQTFLGEAAPVVADA